MAEYRHIANIRGISAYQSAVNYGFEGTEQEWLDSLKGERAMADLVPLNASDVLTELAPDAYRVESYEVMESLGLPASRFNNGVLEVIEASPNTRFIRWTTLARGDINYRFHEVWVLGWNSSASDYVESWERVYPDTSTPGISASGSIKELARRDGWLAVYDPTDTAHTNLTNSGAVNYIEDAMGNLPRLERSGTLPRWSPSAFGQLSSMVDESASGYLRVNFGDAVNEQLTIVTVAQNKAGTTSNNKFIFDGASSGGRNALFWHFDGYFTIYDGSNASEGAPMDTDPHVISAVFDGQDTHSIIDGQLNQYGTNDENPMTPGGLTVGADSNGQRPWVGTIGPVLIYRGRPEQEVLNRMTALLHSLTGIPRRQPLFSPETRVFSVDSRGNETLRVGDPDAFGRSSIQSMTKVMTCWMARKWLPTNSDLDSTFVIDERDVNNDIWRAGDIISYRDAMYSAALPSSNAMPAALAREVGQMMLDDENETSGLSPRQKFVVEMEKAAKDDLGFEGVSFVNPWSEGRLTPRQMVSLMRELNRDPELKEIFGAHTRTITFGGPEARTRVIESSMINAAPHPLHYTSAKSGGGNGVGHVTITWEHPDGTEHTTAIMDTDLNFSTRRYWEFWKAQAAIISGFGRGQQINGGTKDTYRTTLTRDVSDLFGVTERESDSEGVFILRSVDTITITFHDAKLPADLNLPSVLPFGFRPTGHVTGSLMTDLSVNADRVPIRIFPLGTVRVYGNDSGSPLTGQVVYQNQASRFPLTPFIGTPVGTDEGPG